MKICKHCRKEADDVSAFCTYCGGSEFVNTQVPTYNQSSIQYSQPKKTKSPFTLPDLFSVLGFVASLVGLFYVSIFLHPIGAISSFYGFKKGTRLKGLAAAGFIISIIGGIVYLVLSLYHAGLIPKWLTDGAFH